MLDKKNVKFVLDGKAIHDIVSFAISGVDYDNSLDINLSYIPEGYIGAINVEASILGIETDKENLHSKVKDTVSSVTFICGSLA